VAEYRDDYGFFDKALHYLAFNTSKMQMSLARQESDQYAQTLGSLSIKKPVFITSLPRSGTTILLDVLTTTDEFSYHSYKDMPFIFTPLFWSKFNVHFAKDHKLKPRAHNDGIQINQDSAEAFEEMLWKTFWPQAYRGQSIDQWQSHDNNNFDRFFIEHIKKLHLRDRLMLGKNKQRYISKNNLNIARIPYLTRLFPDSIVLTPFRDPLQHALSMLRQHKSFSVLHQHNAFARRYMAAIGHFDFGANLKPINFNQWHDRTLFKPDSLNFWLEYWIESYRYLLDKQKSKIFFISFEDLCETPATSLAVLAKNLDLALPNLQKSITKLKLPKIHQIDITAVKKEKLSEANEIFQRLRDCAM